MTTPSTRRLRLVHTSPAANAAAGSAPDEGTLAAMIAAAQAWAQTTMPLEDARDVPTCRHLYVVPPPD